MNLGRKASLILLISFFSFISPAISYAGEAQKGWYESAVQVLIGGLLVFLATEGHKFFEIKRTKKSLKAGIKCEAKICAGNLMNSLGTLKAFMHATKAKGKAFDFAIPSEVETRIIDSSFDKLGILDEPLLLKIVEFRSLLSAFYGGLRVMKELVPKVNDGHIRFDLYMTYWDGNVQANDRLVQLAWEISNFDNSLKQAAQESVAKKL